NLRMSKNLHRWLLWQVLLSKAERRQTLCNPRIARVAKRKQRVDRQRIGRRIWAEGRKHVRAHRAAQIAAIAAPIACHRMRPLERLALQLERLLVGRRM